jgi:hypothetical protein
MQTMDPSHHPMMSPNIPGNSYSHQEHHRPYGQHQITIQTQQHHNPHLPPPPLPLSPIDMHHQQQQQQPSSPHHNSNQSLSPSASSPNNFLQGGGPQQTKRRRVPNEERKRTAMSCDRCKSRKIKVLSEY